MFLEISIIVIDEVGGIKGMVCEPSILAPKEVKNQGWSRFSKL